MTRDLPTKKYYFDGLLASYVALRLPIKISGIELEILEKIYDSKKLISTKQIARLENIPQESAKYVVDVLDKKGLIEQGSGWKTTETGKVLFKKAVELYAQSKEIILSDKSFSNFLVASGTKIQY